MRKNIKFTHALQQVIFALSVPIKSSWTGFKTFFRNAVKHPLLLKVKILRRQLCITSVIAGSIETKLTKMQSKLDKVLVYISSKCLCDGHANKCGKA